MDSRLPFEYVPGCTGPAVNTDIVPPDLPSCVDPTFETPDVYVSKIDAPDVQPPPCVTPGSDEGGYNGMWKVSASDGGTSTDKIDVVDSSDPTKAGEVVAKAICSGATLIRVQAARTDIPVPPEFLAEGGPIGYVLVKYVRVTGSEFIQPDPNDNNNILIMNKANYDLALAALTPDQSLTLIGRVWTQGGVLNIQQDQFGPISPACGGDCGSGTCNSVACRITGGAGPVYAVNIYANGPGNPLTGTGTLFVMQMLVLNSLAVGTWVLGSEAELGVLGETP